MKITYFKAKNFIGIYAGTGKTEIEIDFTINNKNDIILLLGTNGCGKSSLASIMHPMRETFDARKTIILEGKDGYKEIHLLDNKNVYIVKHYYGNNSSKNKSYITKNGEELNINGNIGSFMDVLQEEFNLNKEYFTIGKIGSNIEGFIGLSTANRKSYINKFIPNIDEYLEGYEIVNEKYKNYNKDIKVLKSSIEKIDENGLLMSKSELETQIKNLNTQLKGYEKAYSINEARLNTINEELKDIPEDLEDVYKESKQLYLDEKAKVEAYLEKYANLKVYTKELLLTKINDNNMAKVTLTDNLANAKANIIRIQEDKSKSNSEIVKYNNLKTEILKDFINPKKIKVDIFNDNSARAAIVDNLILVEQTLTNNGLLEFSKANDYGVAKSETTNLISMINGIRGSYELNIIDTTDILNKAEYSEDLENTRILRTELMEELETLNKEIFYIENNYEKYNKIFSQKPDNCSIPTCVFIKDANSFMTIEYPKLADKIKYQAQLITSIQVFATNINYLVERLEYIGEVNKYITKRTDYVFLSLVVDFTNLNDLIRFSCIFEDTLLEKVGIIKEYNQYIEEIKRLDRTIDSNALLLKTNTQKEIIIVEYDKNIDDLNVELNTIITNLAQAEIEKDDIIHSITVKTNSNTVFLKYKEALDVSETFEGSYKKYEILYNDNQSKILEKVDLEESLGAFGIEINSCNDAIIDYNVKIEEANNQLYLFKIYSDKLKALESTINNIELVKDALDPKRGIPLIFMTNYLNIISSAANILLDRAYGGDFKIAFKVTAKDFLISVYKSDGTVLNDISEASQGEIALTTISLSLAMMENLLSDCKYNILYLDEVDATLSTGNRRIFLELLRLQMEKNIEQCFVISHNDEFYSCAVDLILFKENNIDQEDVSLMENKNILWEI